MKTIDLSKNYGNHENEQIHFSNNIIDFICKAWNFN